MPQALDRILVASDRHRKGEYTDEAAIQVARRLDASLFMVYAINARELILPIPLPTGEMTRAPIRGTALEGELAAEGQEALHGFASRCDAESIRHDETICVGPPDVGWGEMARATDLALVRPAREDFGFWTRCFGAMFWRIATTANRPVLVPGPQGLVADHVLFFYSNRPASSRALPYVAALSGRLRAPVTVQLVGDPKRRYGRVEECEEYLATHGLAARIVGGRGIREVERAAREDATEERLLVFDRPFAGRRWGPPLRRRALVDQFIKDSRSSILLCP